MRHFFQQTMIIASVTLLAFASCKVIAPPEKIPSYLYIEDITVNTNASTQGTTNDNLVDAWIYVNGSLIGIYELPAKIPVIADGDYQLEVFAGIKISGFTAQREIYPFFDSYKATISSTPNKIDTIAPMVTYKTNTTIWVEDFEDPGIKLSSDTTSDTVMFITTIPNEVREGNGSGKVVLQPTQTYFEARTNEPSFNSFPKGGARVYMEIEYNTNHPFSVDVLHGGNNTSLIDNLGDILILNPTSGKWKKTYIDLTTAISSKTAATKFQLNIKAINTNNSNPILFFDNIKIVY